MKTVFQLLAEHYNNRSNAPYSVKEILSLYGRDWLKDSEQVIAFEFRFCICRDGIVRNR